MRVMSATIPGRSGPMVFRTRCFFRVEKDRFVGDVWEHSCYCLKKKENV